MILCRVSARKHKCNVAADTTYDKLWAYQNQSLKNISNSIKHGNDTENKKEYDTLDFSKQSPNGYEAKQREYTEISVPGFMLPKMKNKQEDEEMKQCGTVTSMKCREVEVQALGNGESLYDVARKVPREREAEHDYSVIGQPKPLNYRPKKLELLNTNPKETTNPEEKENKDETSREDTRVMHRASANNHPTKKKKITGGVNENTVNRLVTSKSPEYIGPSIDTCTVPASTARHVDPYSVCIVPAISRSSSQKLL